MKGSAQHPASTTFLGWDRPLVHSASDLLLQDVPPSRSLDLSSRLVIVSSRQAGRRLRQALASRAAAGGSGLLAPRVVTPEFLLSHERCPHLRPPASNAVLTALWIRVLLHVRLAAFPSLFPAPPNDPDFGWASAVAATLIDLQSLLSEAGLSIGDAAKLLRKQGIEPDRWKDLSALENSFSDLIAEMGFSTPAAVRVAAATSTRLPPGITCAYFLATPDLPPLAVEALQRLAQTIPVHVAVFAPPSLAEGFNALGQPLPEYWTQRNIPLTDPLTSIRTHATPGSELAEACLLLTTATGHVAAGVADPSLAAPLQELLAQSNLIAFDPAGRPFQESSLYYLLQTLRALSATAPAEAVASLVRIPTVLDHLAAELARKGAPFDSVRLLSELDALRKAHLPETLSDILFFAQRKAGPELRFALRHFDEWRTQLHSNAFPQALRAVLSQLFFDRGPDSAVTAELEDFAARLSSVLDSFETQPALLEGLNPVEQFSLVLSALSRETHFDEAREAGLDLSGWLELPWEDAPQLVIAGFHDHCVPESISSHIYLPDKSRSLLGLRTNEQRHARDALLLSAILASRPEPGSVRLLFSQFSQAGDPQKPSRLLFQCPDTELAERATQLFRPLPDQGIHGSLAWTRAWLLRPRQLPPDHPVFHTIHVTGFSSYLACPFRHYLRHALGMEEYPLAKREMDAREFGILLHYALEGLGAADSLLHCIDSAELEDFLCSRAEAWVAQQYGPRPALPIRVQLEAARQRLKKAAELLAAQRREGWLLKRVEWNIHGDRPWQIHGMEVRGKIDRVERHETTGEFRVLDFKTSAKALDPMKAHVQTGGCGSDALDAGRPWIFAPSSKGTGRWINLQLPLYCLALRDQLEIEQPVSCGYFNLPSAVSESRVVLWQDLTEETLACSRRCAEGVVDAIRNGVFWPPAERLRYEDFDALFFGSPEAAIEPEARPVCILP